MNINDILGIRGETDLLMGGGGQFWGWRGDRSWCWGQGDDGPHPSILINPSMPRLFNAMLDKIIEFQNLVFNSNIALCVEIVLHQSDAQDKHTQHCEQGLYLAETG